MSFDNCIHPCNQHLKQNIGTSLVVQRLRLHGPNAGGPGLSRSQGTRSHRPQLKDPARMPQLRPGTAK